MGGPSWGGEEGKKKEEKVATRGPWKAFLIGLLDYCCEAVGPQTGGKKKKKRSDRLLPFLFFVLPFFFKTGTLTKKERKKGGGGEGKKGGGGGKRASPVGPAGPPLGGGLL